MKLWNDLNGPVEHEKSLADLTTFRTGGTARYFFHPQDISDLAAAVKICAGEGIEVRFLGGGSNVIVASDTVDAMVIWIHAPFMTSLEFKGEDVIAGAGVSTQHLVRESAGRGLMGLEFMVGVPGTVGGAVGSGASTRRGRFLDAVREAEVIRADGELELYDTENILENGYAVVSCRFKLKTGDPSDIQERMKTEMDYRKETQPPGVLSAGCLFRNPPGDSAGRLIEEAGLKGLRVGDVEVSGVHANFAVNGGSGCGSDVRGLVDRVREGVMLKFGVELELEVDIW